MSKPGNKSGTRDEQGRLLPGVSGNKSGRPKKREELAARCVKAVDEVVFDAWMREVETNGDDWVECSKLLAAYGYGKPAQKLEHTGEGGGPLQVQVLVYGPEGVE